jgi:hypothetical protein
MVEMMLNPANEKEDKRVYKRERDEREREK